mmetsp:Transcript_35521/g.69673  ORF Transcript_35521/g.69673 Transcript_35521/m.69673 type:complete len:216 (+) Transcript_35521:86-733(+)
MEASTARYNPKQVLLYNVHTKETRIVDGDPGIHELGYSRAQEVFTLFEDGHLEDEHSHIEDEHSWNSSDDFHDMDEVGNDSNIPVLEENGSATADTLQQNEKLINSLEAQVEEFAALLQQQRSREAGLQQHVAQLASENRRLKAHLKVETSESQGSRDAEMCTSPRLWGSAAGMPVHFHVASESSRENSLASQTDSSLDCFQDTAVDSLKTVDDT